MENQTVRTCALCKSCEINLGEAGYSELTPGQAGEAKCNRNRWSDREGGGLNLMAMARWAKDCPDFELIELTE